MQPPPRKVKPSVSLKNIHADQVSKLNIKHQQECDLLEDMRTFFSRKAVLEKEYAQGLLKVTGQLLKREFPAQPDLSSEDGEEHKTVCTVWRAILEESDRLAKARLQAAEVYSEKAAEPLKPAKTAKAQCFKKVMPHLSVIQAEVAQCVMDLVKTQKMYMTEAGLAHEARQKSSEAEDKLKRKSTGIFQSLASLQKTCAKLRARTEASEVKETSTRNEYLLSLAAANAHHIRYYSTDLPDIMKTLDCDVYEKIQESLTVAGQTAAEISDKEAAFFHNIAVEAAKICREFSLQCYLFQNPVFTNLVQYQFEPCHGDMCNKLSSDHNAGADLEKEARKWATRVAKETRAIRDYYRQMTVLQGIKSGDKPADSGSQETAVADPEVKLEELRQNIRKSETTKLKAEARLEALRLGGVNVDEWINQAQMESLVAEESGLTRTPSQASLRTESSGGQSGNDDHEPTYTHYDDDDDFIDDTFNTASSGSGRVYPILCKALYDFQASNYDEMTIKVGDSLELVGDGDGEGWVKAKNSLGQEGYIPETYVDLTGQSSTSAPLGVEAMNAINETLSDSSTMRAAPSQQQQSAATSSTPDLQSPTSADPQQDTTSSYSSGDLEVQQATEIMSTGAPSLPATSVTGTEISWARALYDYEAQADEELSFLEGALIRILRKDDGGVDDGFWEGECNGNTGVFPSLVVEELGGPPDDPLSPGMAAGHSDFSMPPPVHVTLPTPEAEPPPPPALASDGEDSQSTPTPTADQRKVRFQQQRRGQHKPHQQHNHQQQQQQYSHPHDQQREEEFVLSRQRRSGTEGCSDRNSQEVRLTSCHPVSVVSPILRHKSLPSFLDRQDCEDCAALGQGQASQHQQGFSHSQPHLSEHEHYQALQQQAHQKEVSEKYGHLQHCLSEPLRCYTLNSDRCVAHVSSSASRHLCHDPASHSQSYPSTPQSEVQASLLQVTFKSGCLYPSAAGQACSDSLPKPLVNLQLYQPLCSESDHRQTHLQQFSSTGTPRKSLTLDSNKHPPFLQTSESPHVVGLSQHHHHLAHLIQTPLLPNLAQPQVSHHAQASHGQQFPCYRNITPRPSLQQQIQQYQSSQRCQVLSSDHARLRHFPKTAGDKLSVFRSPHDDDWESEEGEESLV